MVASIFSTQQWSSSIILPQAMPIWIDKSKRLLGNDPADTQLNHHIVLGPADSYTWQRRYSTTFSRDLKSKYGDGGPGWVGFGYASNNVTSYNGSVDRGDITLTYTNNVGAPITTWTSAYTSDHRSPDLCSVTHSTVGSRVRIQFVGTSVGNITSGSFHFLGGVGQGTFRYSLNAGGAWTTVDASTHPESGVVTFTGASVAPGAVLLCEVVSGSVTLFGAFFRKGRGVIISQIANTGSSLANWSQPLAGATGTTKRAQLAAALATLPVPIDEFMTLIGTNDQTQGGTQTNPDWYDAYESGMGLFVDEVIRVAADDPDILWCMQPENGRNPASFIWRMAGFASRARKVSYTKYIAYSDWQREFGASWSDYSDEFDPDLLHPSVAVGGPHMASISLKLHDPSLG